MAISPSGMDYFSTTPEDVVITDLEANIVDGVRKPSSEWALHTAFYRHKPHARAVVHTHSMYCTTFAVLGQPIRAVHYVIGDAIPGLTKQMVTDYIRYLGNLRWTHLGFGPLFEDNQTEPASMSWVSQYSNANMVKTDFFEAKSTAYAKSTALVDDL